MSTLNGKLGEDFLHIPKLAADGKNWMMYKERLQWSIDTQGLLSHLDGTETKPIDLQTLPNRGVLWAPATLDEVKEVSMYKTELKEWCMGQAITKQQITGTIPDSLFIQIKSLDTVKDIFTHLSSLFKQCSHVVSVELLQKLQDQKCTEKGNIREHFDKMQTIKEQLSSSGHAPSDESFVAMIISSLPLSYDPHLSALMASAKVSSIKLTADMLISTIVNEHDCHVSKSNKSGPSNEDAAYNANANQ